MKKTATIILLFILFAGLCSCKQKETLSLCEEDIRGICELATLECYYNNVAKINKDASNIFQKDRTMWIEYEGKATIGIKMDDVAILLTGSVVSITLPKAEILSTDYTFSENSYVVSEDGWLWSNKISTEEQQAGVIVGQEAMTQSILANEGLFLKAEQRAQELIENYIEKLSNITGEEYTIQWNLG